MMIDVVNGEDRILSRGVVHVVEVRSDSALLVHVPVIAWYHR